MLLESFKAGSDAGYVLIPRMVPRTGYIAYNYAGMAPDEIQAWKNVVTVPEVKRARPATEESYMKVLQALGIRCAVAGTESSHALRAEFNAIPLHRRLK